jgi:phage-related protein
MKAEKAIYWIGTSYKDLLNFPDEAKRDAGYQLHRVQNGLEPENWKPFQSIGAGVKEIRISTDGNAFRVIYIAKFSGRIYVLHSFQKKTQKTRSQDINIAKARYRAIVKGENHEED